jgi:hypothetical protein
MKDSFIVLVPKTDDAKAKLGYHGDKWLLRCTQENPKYRAPGTYFRVMSRDGKKLMFIRDKNDPDFDTRTI